MEIEAAIANVDGTLTVESCFLSAPSEQEVLVKIEACGICHTDLLALKGDLGTPLPAVLGHEGVGRIEQLGDGVIDFAIGERVLMSFGACGECSPCRQQATAYCRRALQLNFLGQRLDGSTPVRRCDMKSSERLSGHFFAQSSFATHAIARTTNLVKLPEDIPAELLAPLACGVQTGVSSIVNVLQPKTGQRLAVFGCGTVGLAAVVAARNMGCSEIVAVDLKPQRRALAARLGATHTLGGGDRNESLQALQELMAAIGGVHLAFDTTGHPDVIAQAFAQLRQQGKMLCAGVSPPGTELTIDPRQLVFGGRAMLGTVEGNADPRTFIPTMIDWYRQGKLPLQEWVVTYPFHEVRRAMADLAAGRVIKPVLLMPQ